MKKLLDLLRNYFKPSDYSKVLCPLFFDNLDLETSNILSVEENIRELKKLNIFDDIKSEIKNNSLSDVFEFLCNEQTSAEYYTPIEVLKLAIKIFGKNINSIYDPTCGIGNIFSLLPNAKHFGQELNPESYALCKLRFPNGIIKQGNSLINDCFADQKFKFIFTNPPFGLNWSREKETVLKDSRFFDIPSIKNGEILFLQHCLSKLAEDGKIIWISSCNPTFSAGWKLREYLIEEDLLEGIIWLPNKLFVGTPLQTVMWIISNQKQGSHFVKVVNASNYYEPHHYPLKNRRYKIDVDQIMNDYNNRDCLFDPIFWMNDKQDYIFRSPVIEKENKEENNYYLNDLIRLRDDLTKWINDYKIK